MSLALKEATPRSLIIIDEFGKGTEPKGGVALLAATVRYWLDASPPHLMVATHFRSLSRLLGEHPQLHYRMLEVICPMDTMPQQEEYEREYDHTYKIIDGTAQTSLALVLAKQARIGKAVLSRAKTVMEAFEQNTDPKKFTPPMAEKRYLDEEKEIADIAKLVVRADLTTEDNLKELLTQIRGSVETFSKTTDD